MGASKESFLESGGGSYNNGRMHLCLQMHACLKPSWGFSQRKGGYEEGVFGRACHISKFVRCTFPRTVELPSLLEILKTEGSLERPGGEEQEGL